MQACQHFLLILNLSAFRIKNVMTLQVELLMSLPQLQQLSLLLDYQQFFLKIILVFLELDLNKLMMVKILWFKKLFKILLMILLIVLCFFCRNLFMTKDHMSTFILNTQFKSYGNHFEIFPSFALLQFRFIFSLPHSKILCLQFTSLLSIHLLVVMFLVSKLSWMLMDLIMGRL